MIIVLQQTTTTALIITGFVFMMMVIIEYLNVISRGVWQQGLRGSRWRQYLRASFLGAPPGCLGVFTVISLYSHREVSHGALVAGLVATSGDESFVMLSMIPERALYIFILLFFLLPLLPAMSLVLLGLPKTVIRQSVMMSLIPMRSKVATVSPGEVIRLYYNCMVGKKMTEIECAGKKTVLITTAS